MKTTLLILLICTFPFVNISAKEKKITFGKIDKEDLEMQVYEKDSSASAVVLYDYGTSEIEYVQNIGWKLLFKRHQRIKILKAEGVDYGDYSISLYQGRGDSEELGGIKAITFNLENGKVVKNELKRKDVHTEKVNEYWNTESFSLPQVKAGSVIDVKYTVDCKAFFRNIRPWKFQRGIPTLYSEYFVKIPEYFHFRKFVRGFESFETFKEDAIPTTITLSSISRTGEFSAVKSEYNVNTIRLMDNTYHWVAKDMPALDDEAFVSSIDNYIQQVDFELQSVKMPEGKLHNYSQSWESINEDLTNDFEFGKMVFGKHGYLSGKVAELTSNIDDDTEKIKAIYKYVANNFKHNGISSIYPQDARKTWKDKNGNVADINLLLAAMLNEAGFDAKPVILSTRNNGIFVYPTVTGFNYVVVQCSYDKGKVLLDATQSYYGFNQLPFKCYNGTGLIIGGKQPDWIDLMTLGKSTLKYTSQLQLQTDGTLTGWMRATRSGLSALRMRSDIRDFTNLDEYKEDFADKKADWSIDDQNFKNLEETDKPLVQDLKLDINNAVVDGGERIYFTPTVFCYDDENPFKLNEREYPVDFGCRFSEGEMITFMLPEGTEVEQLPKSEVITLPGEKAVFRYGIQKLGEDKLQVFNSLKINQSVFLPEEYKYLQEFFNKIIEKHNEQVILKKL